MLEIKTEKIIDTNIEVVWEVLANFSDYKNWNSFITNITGILAEREKISVSISPPNQKTQKFTPRILRAKKAIGNSMDRSIYFTVVISW